MIAERGAVSCYVDYHPSFGASPFGKVLCTSVNDAVLHGLPHDYALQDGDLLSLDFACSVDGWVADSAISLVVGTPRPGDLELIDVATRALAAGIEQARVGNRLTTSRPRSATPRAPPASASTCSSAATAWAGRCTVTRTCRTTVAPAGASSSS